MLILEIFAKGPRPGEKDGVDYHFSDRETMERMRDDGEFIETAEFSGNMYGTSKKAVEDVAANGKVCILDIDVQVWVTFAREYGFSKKKY